MSFSSRHNPQIQTQANTPEISPREEIDGAHAKHHICNNNHTYSSSAIQQEESEYTLTLKSALKTAMDENETVSEFFLSGFFSLLNSWQIESWN